MKRISWLLVWLFTFLSVTAQTYWYEEVDKVSRNGYYNIEVSQAIYGLGAKTLRIFDTKEQEIPYFVRFSAVAEEAETMKTYEVVSNTARDSVNTIVVHNTAGETSRFYLQMKSADVTMFISVRGSYDNKQWFTVKQRSRLKSEYYPEYGEVTVVDFPKGDYTYYELVIINNTNSPLSITGVGRVELQPADRQFVELPSGNFTVERDGNITLISFPEMEYPYYLFGVEFDVKGKGLYSREVQISHPNRMSRTLLLTSREKRYYIDGLLIDKETRIEILNEDNLPLEIERVKLLGNTRYLCAYLEEGVAYRIETGGEGYRRYDIQNFTTEIPAVLPVVKTGNLMEAEKTVVQEQPRLRFFEKPVFLWSVIVVMGLGLLVLCIRMLREKG